MKNQKLTASHPSPQGRLDQLAHGVFQKLLDVHGNPIMKLGCSVLEEEIQACFEENLGPHTPVGKVGTRIVRAVERLQK